MRLTIIFGDEKRDFDLDADTLHGALQKCGVLFSLPCGGRGICKGCRAMVAVEGDEYKSVLVCRSAFDRDMTVMLPRSGVTVDWPDMGTLADAFRDDDGDDRTEDGKSFGSADESGFGLAVDIGTTTLGLALCHGDDLGVAAFALYENPQRSYGADVISRIKAASNGNAAKMQDAVTGSIRSISREICTAGGAGRLSKMVIAGNTTMIHLLLGEDVSHMGEYPFDPGDISMRHIVFDDTDTYIMPGISAFVGGDIVSGMYAMGMADDQDKTTLLIDLGTNGEMVIGNGREFLATSTAAGPAFEAVGISCGMAGVTGAISDIRLMPLGSGGRVVVTRSVIRDEKGVMPSPRGVCGSGLIAAVSELVRLGLLDKSGAYTTEKLRRDGFMLYQGSGYEKNIILTQDDVRTLLVAKAAVSAGIRILVEEWMSGIGHKSPEAVYLAGGFGDGLDLNAAVGIGLIPVEWKDITKPMGNTSLWGAEKLLRALMDGRDDELRKPGDIVSKTRVINLAEDKDFNSIYLEEMCYE